MDYRLKKQISTFTLFILGSVTVGSMYQNCSKVMVTDLASEEKAMEAERIALARDSETVTAGLNPVPDLKMFFVVDNSGTMKANQLNLSQSFGAMFDQTSKDSLSKFKTSAYLLSTAQRSLLLNDQTNLNSIVTKQAYYNPTQPLSLDVFSTSYRTAQLNSGYLPGDNIGYKVTKTSSPLSYTFNPAPVLGWSSPGANLLNGVITREARDVSGTFEQQFKERLAVLDSSRIPLVSVGGVYRPENYTIVDSESGLCAIARVLREPEAYLKSGDLFSFIVVSDEDDNDPEGNNCILKQTRHQGDVDLYNGVCERKQTAINYTTLITNETPAKCRINGKAGYLVRFSYPDQLITTLVSYRTLDKEALYKTPKTDIKYYYKVPQYTLQQTQVTYFTKNCVNIVSDGLVIGQNCQYSASATTSGWLTGDHSSASACYSLALTQNSKATNDAGKQPVCKTQANVVSSCDTANANCSMTNIISSTQKTVTVMGALTQAQATTRAQTFADYWSDSAVSVVSGFYPETTTPCTTEQTAAGCVMSSPRVYGSASKEASGNQTTDGCLTYAKSQAGNAVSSLSDVTRCELKTTATTKIVAANVPFSLTKSVDGGATLDSTAANCGAIYNIAFTEAKKVSSALPSQATCQITGTYAFSQREETLTSECSSQAANYCSPLSYRSCTASLVAATSTTTPSAQKTHAVVSEELTCQTLCKNSQTDACGALTAATENMTIESYIKSVYGSTATCAVATQTVANSQVNVTAVSASQEATICKPVANGTGGMIPTYYRRTSNAYRLESDVIEHVAGSVVDSTGKAKPAKSLVQYIQDRSKELSKINPIFAALVRTSSDPLGDGGSVGKAYEELVQKTEGTLNSALSNDYSPALQSLGKVIKNALERSFVLQKMRPDQVIFRVHRIAKDTNTSEVLDSSLWKQSGVTITLHESLEFKDGDQFRIEFQNNVQK